MKTVYNTGDLKNHNNTILNSSENSHGIDKKMYVSFYVKNNRKKTLRTEAGVDVLQF